MKLYPSISEDLGNWAQQQPVFFTGSAGTHSPHINVSPKGMTGTHFAVLGPNQCAYIDRTGSGCETISHAYENGRLCIMFMSFGTNPRILRLFCHATVIEWDRPAFPDLVRRIAKGQRKAFDGARAVILCDIWEVQTSCGYAVPRVKKGLYAPDCDKGPSPAVDELLRQGKEGCVNELSVFEERPTLDVSAMKSVQQNRMQKYQASNNAESIDGLPGLRAARREAGQMLWFGDTKATMQRISSEREGVAAGFLLAVVMYLIWSVLANVLSP